MVIGYNEVIDVCDESIIRNNEHPKFKIGDVINNGYGNFIVTGFTRSYLGLAYVLDNGYKLIGWLTKDVDKECHFVELRQIINYSTTDKQQKCELKSEIQLYIDEYRKFIDKYIKFIYVERCGDKFYGTLTDKNGATFEFSKDVTDIEKFFNNTHNSLYEDADIRKIMLMSCFKRIFIGIYKNQILLKEMIRNNITKNQAYTAAIDFIEKTYKLDVEEIYDHIKKAANNGKFYCRYYISDDTKTHSLAYYFKSKGYSCNGNWNYKKNENNKVIHDKDDTPVKDKIWLDIFWD